MRRFVVGIVVALAASTAVITPTRSARADATQDAALLHLDRGVAAFNAKDFARARTEFEAAHDLAPDKANPYRWLALTEIQLGDCTAALPNIEGFLARVPPTDARVAEMARWREFCSKPATQPQGSGAQNAGTQVTGTQVTPTQHAPAPHKALHQRWWFWPLVGGAALAVTGGIVYAATTSDATTLPPIRCTETGCAR
jgi:hypothetical protein